MHFRHRGRVGQIELVEALVEADPAPVQHGPHRAIGEQGVLLSNKSRNFALLIKCLQYMSLLSE